MEKTALPSRKSPNKINHSLRDAVKLSQTQSNLVKLKKVFPPLNARKKAQSFLLSSTKKPP